MKKFFNALFKQYVLLFLIIGIALLVIFLGDTITSFMPSKDFEDIMEYGLEVGDHVSGNLLYSFDYFAVEDTVTTHKGGTTTTSKGTAYFYVIPGDYNLDVLYGLEVRKADSSEVSKNTDETFEYLDGAGEPVTRPYMEGKAVKMDDEMAKYFKKYLEDSGYTSDEIKAMGDFIMVDYISFISVRIATLAGIVFLLLGIVFFILEFRKLSKIEANSMNANYNSGENYQPFNNNMDVYNQPYNQPVDNNMDTYNQTYNNTDAYGQSQNGYNNYYGYNGQLVSLELIDAGENKVKVINEIRNITGLGLAEAKEIVDRAPRVVKSEITTAEAENFKSMLEAAGATVSIR